MAKKQRHAYTEEFRREAVSRSDQPGNTAASVAKELGLHPGQIYNWRRQFSRLSEKQFNSLAGVDYSKTESEEVRRLKRELNEDRKENEFLKKGCCVLREAPGVKYALIAEHLGQYPVELMCRVLEVSRSGFYKWQKRPPCATQLRREAVERKVVELFSAFKARYGAPRLVEELKDAGLPCSKNFVANIMRLRGIRARNGKGFHYRPASPTMINVEENLLRRRFRAEEPDQKWVTDITYSSKIT